MALLDPAYFEEVYGGVQLGRGGGVALVGQGLGVRALVIGGKTEFLGAVSHQLRTPLSSIRGFAELMGGRLTVSSAPGQGSRFTLALPLA